MEADIDKIKKSNEIIVKADKTCNMYKMTKAEYNKLLLNNITDNYKKSDKDVLNEINQEAKEIAKDLELDDRINRLPTRNAYITLKDHKENFCLKPKCRLINPTKSEIGKISKVLLERVN